MAKFHGQLDDTSEPGAAGSSDHPGSMALSLEGMPVEQRGQQWSELSPEMRAEVLPHLHDGVKTALLNDMDAAEIFETASKLAVGDVAEVIELVDEEVAQDIVDSLSDRQQQRLQQTLEYGTEQAGRLLDYTAIALHPSRRVSQVLAHIKQHGLPVFTDKIILVDNSKQYQGAVSLSTLLQAGIDEKVSALAKIEQLDIVNPSMPIQELTRLFRQNNYVSLPVVNDDGIFLGRITLDDAIDLLQGEADHQLMGLAGLDESEDLFAPVINSSARRAVWLGINLLTALLASWVIGIFEDTIQKVVALAVLMPIVASMGGIAGSQTLTIAIRGLALGQINDKNQLLLLRKELLVGLCNGMLWALGVAVIAYLWFRDPTLCLVLAAAVFVNLIAAAFAGLLIPLALERLKIDPALAGSVVLTTVTDLVGFAVFLGLGTIWLLN